MSRLVLVVAIMLQAWLSTTFPGETRGQVPQAPPPLMQWTSLGEPALAARLAMLALQSADDAQGTRTALHALDYAQVEAWLDASLRLDPRSAYPLQAAALVYAPVNDAERSRRMLDFIARHYEEAPSDRRIWMEHAVVLARHHLQDAALANRLQEQLNHMQGGAAERPLPLD